MAEKKQVVTYTGLKKIEEELQDLKLDFLFLIIY